MKIQIKPTVLKHKYPIIAKARPTAGSTRELIVYFTGLQKGIIIHSNDEQLSGKVGKVSSNFIQHSDSNMWEIYKPGTEILLSNE